jgi:hypothetical protein
MAAAAGGLFGKFCAGNDGWCPGVRKGRVLSCYHAAMCQLLATGLLIAKMTIPATPLFRVMSRMTAKTVVARCSFTTANAGQQ